MTTLAAALGPNCGSGLATMHAHIQFRYGVVVAITAAGDQSAVDMFLEFRSRMAVEALGELVDRLGDSSDRRAGLGIGLLRIVAVNAIATRECRAGGLGPRRGERREKSDGERAEIEAKLS